jgi:acetyl-CoA carboxylase biotin carboxyl carrier protein
MDLYPLTNADVADILALLDSLPYDELDLETPRFKLTLRRTPGGWTQSSEVRITPTALTPAAPDADEISGAGEGSSGGGSAPEQTASMPHPGRHGDMNATSLSLEEGQGAGKAGAGRAAEDGGGDEVGGAGELVAVRAPLPGTFYRAPRPGAAPFVEVGSRVGADSVIGIVETMKLMNSVHAGVAGTVAEFCARNAEFAAHGATLLRIRADR